MLIYIIRHGETDLNAAGVLQGWYDQPLNDSGRFLAAETGKKLKGVRFDGCFSSPLKRAAETAEILLRESGNEIPVIYDDRLKEMSFGVKEGSRLSPEEAAVFRADPRRLERFAGGETAVEVCRRTQDFLLELAERDDGGRYLVSTHGTALRCMLNMLYDDPSDFWQGHVPYNCAVNIVEAEKGRMRLAEADRIYYDRKYIVDRYADLNSK